MIESQILSRGISDEAVINAMRAVKRHLFVPRHQLPFAYADGALAIGFGQTISQPYIVAYMSEQLKLTAGDRVLEIGCGSGYQAAVLSEIVDEVFTVEIIPELEERARKRFGDLGYSSIHLKQGDGYYGWEDEAPFDAIIVSAAAEEVPLPLVEQLSNGGRMIIPLGEEDAVQRLILIRNDHGEIIKDALIAVRFVPFTRS